MKDNKFRSAGLELPTFALIISCYIIWLSLVLWGGALPTLIWIVLAALNTTLFWSIIHEVVHGHPTRIGWVNRILVLFPIGWIFPYERFRETHIEHHRTDSLTDPFDDPESWYIPSTEWGRTNSLIRKLMIFNNTLFGRMLIGPIINVVKFLVSEIRHVTSDSPKGRMIALHWLVHIALCAAQVWFLIRFGEIGFWALFASVYLGTSFLLIRTFLEHQAAAGEAERTVIIDTCCPIAFLFLFNNLHFVHHQQPGIPWYKLPEVYKADRDNFIAQNNGYVYRSYMDVFKRYFFKTKEPVPHPFVSG